jgi:lipoyl(octanoyl) transferase
VLLGNREFDSVEWLIAEQPVDYPAALRFMEDRVEAIRAGHAAQCVWLLQHPPLYTAGTSAKAKDLLDPHRFPVYDAGRGGEYTYHGPGQRVAYVMLDLKRHGADIRRFVHDLEEWVIRALARFGVKGERREGRVGIWICRDAGTEDKICAIGVRVRRWVSFHGVAINVDPDLSHFGGIVPCGIHDHGVTSLRNELGCSPAMTDVDDALRSAFAEVFGPSA